jgi:hypothetical protein
MAKRWAGVTLGVVLGLVLAAVLGPWIARGLGGHRAERAPFVIGGGF